MNSNFTVQCPCCFLENDFIDDNWQDELVDDTDHTYIDCMHCGYPLEIVTNAVYTLEVVNTEIEETCNEHCNHLNEVQRQGNGFVYTVCGDCGEELD